MQSVLLYGRLLARALATGINNEFQPFCSRTKALRHCVPLRFVTAVSGISKSQSPHQVPRRWSFGDDACFLAKHKFADVIGVADGVGGWRSYGIDPSKFSTSLMSTCERIVKEGHFAADNPSGLLANSYYELQQNKVPLIGSSTACVVALHRQEGSMYTANLGDSGFRVVREGRIVHKSEEQQHYFNTPFQLSVTPPNMAGFALGDSPESAQTTCFKVEEGDVILLGTDGLFDNMNDEMLVKQLKNLRDFEPESIQAAANSIVDRACELAFDPEYESPFSCNAKAMGIHIRGGKPDDITVVVAKVTGDEIT